MDDSRLERELTEIKVGLVRIEERLEAHAQVHIRNSEDASDRERRIRTLERWRYTIPSSIILAIGSIIAALAA